VPKGVPKNGFRMTKKRMASGFSSSTIESVNHSTIQLPQSILPVIRPQLTVEQIQAKMAERFDALDKVADAVFCGRVRGMVVSGPGGLGKSYSIERKIDAYRAAGHHVTHISGYVRPLSMYRLLYNSRYSGSVIVFDDADSVFDSDIGINLLKKACDTTDRRTISWLSNSIEQITDEDGESIPEQFEFEGAVIFITNLDFDAMIARGSKMSTHYEAFMTRTHYLDLDMKTNLDYIVRIKQVVAAGMLRNKGLTDEESSDIISFIEENAEKLRELSLRIALKLADLYIVDPKNWQSLARQTCIRNS